MAAVSNATFASPLANADYTAAPNAAAGGLLFRLYDGMNGFNVFASLLLVLIAYDQCECARSGDGIVRRSGHRLIEK